MTPENPSAQVPRAEEAQRINEAPGADCLHGRMKRDGDDMPVKAWDCYGCTARIVSEMLTAAREEASREAARDAYEDAESAIRAACEPCGGTGGERTSRAAHAPYCSGECDGNCPVEVEDWEECQYCGRPIAAIRARLAKGGKANG